MRYLHSVNLSPSLPLLSPPPLSPSLSLSLSLSFSPSLSPSPPSRSHAVLAMDYDADTELLRRVGLLAPEKFRKPVGEGLTGN